MKWCHYHGKCCQHHPHILCMNQNFILLHRTQRIKKLVSYPKSWCLSRVNWKGEKNPFFWTFWFVWHGLQTSALSTQFCRRFGRDLSVPTKEIKYSFGLIPCLCFFAWDATDSLCSRDARKVWTWFGPSTIPCVSVHVGSDGFVLQNICHLLNLICPSQVCLQMKLKFSKTF